MKRLLLALFLIASCYPSLQPCRWCFANRARQIARAAFAPEKVGSLEDSGDDSSRQSLALLPQDELGETHTEPPSGASKYDQTIADNAAEYERLAKLFRDHNIIPPEGTYAPAEQGRVFFQDGIYDHYPKVMVLRDQYFPTMCPVAVDAALQEVVNVLTVDDWFFFKNKKKDFDWGAHWERIVGILKILRISLNRMYVDAQSNLIFERQIGPRAAPVSPGCKRLMNVWRESGMHAIDDFYALSFDYTIKLFHEGIKFRDRKAINKYYFQLLGLMPRLRKTAQPYRDTYCSAIDDVKRLRSLFLQEEREKKEARAGRAA